MKRGRQLRRVLRLRAMLARREGVSVTAAARELGCSRRTIYRDLHALEAEGFALFAGPDGEGGTWRLLEGPGGEAEVAFTRDELAALWIASASLSSLERTPLAEAARRALDKVGALLAEPRSPRPARARAGAGRRRNHSATIR